MPEQIIQLIRSFHQGMEAKFFLEGRGDRCLRQDCCVAPVLFNLYMCLMMECWHDRVERVPGIGVNLKYKYDEKLFRRYTRNAMERKLTECLFADDGAILASTR